MCNDETYNQIKKKLIRKTYNGYDDGMMMMLCDCDDDYLANDDDDDDDGNDDDIQPLFSLLHFTIVSVVNLQ